MVLALVQAVIALVVAFGINLAPDQIVAAARSAAALTAAAAVFAAASSCAWLKGLGSGAGRMVVTSGRLREHRASLMDPGRVDVLDHANHARRLPG